MTELEDLIRADLQQATEDVGDDLDVDALLATGRRRRTARTARRLAGVAAVAVVASLVSWAGLGGRLTGDVPVLATPAPASPTASGTPTLSPSAGADSTAIFGGGTDELPDGADGKRILVKATVTGTGYDVDFTLEKDDGSTKTEHRANDGRTLTWVQLGPRLVVTFLPHHYDWISLQKAAVPAFSDRSSDQMTYGNLDATAGYLVADADSAGDFPGVEGYLWRWQKGPFYNQDGEIAPSVSLSLSGTRGNGVFYADEKLDVLGLDRDGQGSERPYDASDVDTFNDWSGKAGGLAVGGVVLPLGASDAVLTSAGEDLEVTTGTLKDRVVMLAGARMPKADQPLFTAVTYTDADGRRVTKKFGR